MPSAFGNLRKTNLMKFDSVTGRLIWARHIVPPFWPKSRQFFSDNESVMTGASGMNVSPIHGTDDVAIRLTRAAGSYPLVCTNAVARVSKWGTPKWWYHIHGTQGGRDLCAFEDGRLCLSKSLLPTAQISAQSSTIEIIAIDGTADSTLYTEGPTSNMTPISLFEIAGENEPLWWRRINGLGGGGPDTVLVREDVWTRGYITTRCRVNTITASASMSLNDESWNDLGLTYNHSGLVLRSNTGSGYLMTFGDPTYDPPQADVIAYLMEQDYQDEDPPPYGAPAMSSTPNPPIPTDTSTTVSYWSADYAAIHDGYIYVIGYRNTETVSYTNWNWLPAAELGAGWYAWVYQFDRVVTQAKKLIKFDLSFGIEWQQDLTGAHWGIIADDNGPILGCQSASSSRYGGYNFLERRDTAGNVVWKQAAAATYGLPSTMPSEMCFADDGYLYVATPDGIF